MSLLERLKEETRELHETTESLLLGPKLLAGTLQEQEFLTLLYVNLSFHDALERTLAAHSDFFSGYDLPARRKVPCIEADLKTLKAPMPENRPVLFAGWTPYQLLGAAYVAEGSTLGSRLISNVLNINTHLSAEARQSIFYKGYGEVTGPRWKAFREFLTNRADDHDDEVIYGANEAFRLFQRLVIEPSQVLYHTEL